MRKTVQLFCFVLLLFSIGCKSSKPTTLKNQTASAPSITETKNFMDPFAEKHIGYLLLNEVLKEHSLVYNAKFTRYITEVGSHVSITSTRKTISYEFHIVDSNEIFSIGLPGGIVLISKGLLQKIETESELAALLGVEIVNIEKQYLLRLLQKEQTDQDLASNFDANTKKIEETATFLMDNRFADEQINEADRLGMVYAQHFGYIPNEFNQLLKRLYQMQQDDPKMVFKGQYNDSILAHRQSMGEVYVKSLSSHQEKFPKAKDRYAKMKKYL